MRRIILIVLAIGIGSSVQADLIDLLPEGLERAPHIVVGEVVDVEVFDVQIPDETFSPSHRRGNIDRHYRYTIRINEVEKTRGDLEAGDFISVEAWRMLHRPGGLFATIGYQGHRPLPAKGDLIRAYLKGGQRMFEPLDPNGFAPAFGGTLGPPVPRGTPGTARQRFESFGGWERLVPGSVGFVIGVLAAGLAFQIRHRNPHNVRRPVRVAG